MSDDRPPDDAVDPADPGPIPELAELRHPPSSTFLERVHNRISRRVLGKNVAQYFWHVPLIVMLEFLEMIFQAAGGKKRG